MGQYIIDKLRYSLEVITNIGKLKKRNDADNL